MPPDAMVKGMEPHFWTHIGGILFNELDMGFAMDVPIPILDPGSTPNRKSHLADGLFGAGHILHVTLRLARSTR